MKISFKTTKVFDKNLECSSDKRIIVNQGGTSCFDGEQKVITFQGAKPIKDIRSDDMVLTLDERTKERTWSLVQESMTFENTKPTIKVTLKNGHTITATEDHKFYYEGGWYSLKHLLSLWDERTMENNTELHKVSSKQHG